jgi:hypothetical protein
MPIRKVSLALAWVGMGLRRSTWLDRICRRIGAAVGDFTAFSPADVYAGLS